MIQTAQAPAAAPPRAPDPPAASVAPALDAIRRRIDAIDDQLLALVADRLALAREVGRIKGHRHLVRADREAALLARVAAGSLPPAVARAIWVQLIAAMLAEEGIVEIIVAEEALRLPAILRFGQVLPIRVAPDWRRHAARHDAITIAPPDAAAPPGCAVLMALPECAGLVIGPDPEAAR
jgi:chorismate mutase